MSDRPERRTGDVSRRRFPQKHPAGTCNSKVRIRLTQMDLERRQGEGKLSEVLGSQALDQNRFEVMVGLERSAEAEWRAMPTDSTVRQFLLAYAQGVNTRINEDEQHGALP